MSLEEGSGGGVGGKGKDRGVEEKDEGEEKEEDKDGEDKDGEDKEGEEKEGEDNEGEEKDEEEMKGEEKEGEEKEKAENDEHGEGENEAVLGEEDKADAQDRVYCRIADESRVVASVKVAEGKEEDEVAEAEKEGEEKGDFVSLAQALQKKV